MKQKIYTLLVLLSYLFSIKTNAQTNCSNAVNISADTAIIGKAITYNYWFKFQSNDSSLRIALNRNIISGYHKIKEVAIYKGNCITLDTIGVYPIDSVVSDTMKLRIIGLAIGTTYFVEVRIDSVCNSCSIDTAFFSLKLNNSSLMPPNIFQPFAFYDNICGLDYCFDAIPTNQRPSTNGIIPAPPYTFDISCIPANAHIIDAYVFLTTVENSMAMVPIFTSFDLKNPGNTINTFNAQLTAGGNGYNSTSATCWSGFTLTGSYFAQIPLNFLSPTGNGIYTIENFLPAYSQVDVTGATLYIVYSTCGGNPARLYLWAGLDVVGGNNNINYIESGINNYNTKVQQKSIAVFSDVEKADFYPIQPENWTICSSFPNYQIIPPIFYSLNEIPSTTQNFAINVVNLGDCYALSVLGLYFKDGSNSSCQPFSLSISPANPVLCNSGQVTAIVNNGQGSLTGWSFLWSTAPAQTTVSATIATAGVYTVTVTDPYGCSQTASVNVTISNLVISGINSIPACLGQNTGQANVTNISGGVSPYSYLWSSNSGNQVTNPAINLALGFYTVTVTDVNGCSTSGSVEVKKCCDGNGYPGYTTYNNTTFTSGTWTGAKMIFDGIITIAPWQAVTFDHCDILMGQNAKIEIEMDATLHITSSNTSQHTTIQACYDMWDGIKVENNSNGHLIIDNGTVIKDGLNAAWIKNPGVVNISNSIFDRNRISVYLTDGDYFTSTITHNSFKCTSVLALNLLGATYSDAHIFLNMADNVTIDNNQFTDKSLDGIRSLKSKNAHVVTNHFMNITEAGVWAIDKGDMIVEQSNIFENCGAGVVTGQFTRTVVDANIFERNNWSIACIGNLVDIDVYNNTINNSTYFGILSMYNNNNHQHYYGNRISRSTSNPNKAAAIVITNSTNNSSQLCNVHDNQIEYHATGIGFSAVDYAWSEANTITMPVNNSQLNYTYYGINAEGGGNITLFNNTINGKYTNDLVPNGFGILEKQSNNNNTWCNNIYNFNTGVQYQDMTSTLDLFGFAGNKMNTCVDQLYLLNVPQGLGPLGVSAQPSDNIWDGNINHNTVSNASNVNGGFTDFTVRPNTNITYVGINNAVINVGNACTFNVSGNPNAPDFCDYIQMAGDDKDRAMRLKNAMEGLSEEGLRFENARDLLTLLNNNESIADSSVILQNVKDSLDQTVIGDFAFITDSLLNLVDSTLSWLNNDSTLYAADSLYLAGTIQLRQWNNSIPTTIIAEWNRKKVNNIQLNTVAIGNSVIKSAQVNQLRYIANQCERIGGDAVIEARWMLVLVDSSMTVYSNACVGIAVRNIQPQKNGETIFKVYPNPITDFVTVSTNDFQNASILITDIIGKVLLTQNLKSKEELLNLCSLANGIYKIHLARSGIIIKTQKLIVIK